MNHITDRPISYTDGSQRVVDEIVCSDVKIHLESMGKGVSLLLIHKGDETLAVTFTAHKGGQLYVTAERH